MEETPQGPEIRLASKGAARFLAAPFLVVWLCGWAIGESVVFYLLAIGAWALITGKPPRAGQRPLDVGFALAMGAFLIFWLAMWTLGGIAAIGELLRLVAGEDRLVAGPEGLVVTHRRGPFRSTRTIPRERLRRLHVVRRNAALVAETDRERIELSRLGTSDERWNAIARIHAALGIGPEETGAAAALPPGFEEIVTPEGERALIPDRAIRRRQAGVAAVAAAAMAALAVGTAVAGQSGLVARAIAATVLGALAVLLGWGTVWLARGRMEWRIGSGRITLRRRFGDEARDVFAAQRLELTTRSDSDGDDWFTLEGIAADDAFVEIGRKAPQRRTITKVMNDPIVPRRLGEWLAQRADVKFEDRSAGKGLAA